VSEYVGLATDLVQDKNCPRELLGTEAVTELSEVRLQNIATTICDHITNHNRSSGRTKGNGLVKSVKGFNKDNENKSKRVSFWLLYLN
jgi:hypothetical protein